MKNKKEFKWSPLGKDPADVRRGKDVKGEASPYWDAVNKRSFGEDGAYEDVKANPDKASVSPYDGASEATREQYEKVVEAMATLSPRELEIVLLLQEGKSQAQISSLLGIKAGAVRTYLLRARNKIAKLVSD